MKKVVLVCCISLLAVYAKSQEQVVIAEEAKKGWFKKENLFTGGSLNVSFGNATVLGINPVLGYSINKFIDAGMVLNMTYTAFRYSNGDKEHYTVYGPGAFVKLYPVNFLFLQGQYEHNFINSKYFFFNSGNEKINFDVNSFLIGAGYSVGRENVGSLFYYVSVLLDVSNNPLSPYTDEFNRKLPIIRAGIQIPLFQGKK